MRVRAILGVALIVLTSLAACGGDVSSEGTPAGADPFPLAVGDRWVFEVAEPFVPPAQQIRTVTGTREVAGTQAFVVQVDGVSAGELLYTRDDVVVVELADPRSVYAMAVGPRVILRLPLRVGDAWIQTDKTVDSGSDFDGDGRSDEAVVRADVLVEGTERVQTPAGSFDGAFVVVTTISATVLGSADGHVFEPSRESRREWFAPGVGLVRRDVAELPSGGVRQRLRSEVLTGYRIVAQRT